MKLSLLSRYFFCAFLLWTTAQLVLSFCFPGDGVVEGHQRLYGTREEIQREEEVALQGLTTLPSVVGWVEAWWEDASDLDLPLPYEEMHVLCKLMPASPQSSFSPLVIAVLRLEPNSGVFMFHPPTNVDPTRVVLEVSPSVRSPQTGELISWTIVKELSTTRSYFIGRGDEKGSMQNGETVGSNGFLRVVLASEARRNAEKRGASSKWSPSLPKRLFLFSEEHSEQREVGRTWSPVRQTLYGCIGVMLLLSIYTALPFLVYLSE